MESNQVMRSHISSQATQRYIDEAKAMRARIAELEAEVARLREQLAILPTGHDGP